MVAASYPLYLPTVKHFAFRTEFQNDICVLGEQLVFKQLTASHQPFTHKGTGLAITKGLEACSASPAPSQHTRSPPRTQRNIVLEGVVQLDNVGMIEAVQYVLLIGHLHRQHTISSQPKTPAGRRRNTTTPTLTICVLLCRDMLLADDLDRNGFDYIFPFSVVV